MRKKGAMAKMNNLKPCPFCGGVAELKAPGYEYYSPCWCKCTRCGAEGPTKSSELEAEKGWNERVQDDVERARTVGGWINSYEWICPACGLSILVKTSKQNKAIGMQLSVCPVCGKEIVYGKTD